MRSPRVLVVGALLLLVVIGGATIPFLGIPGFTASREPGGVKGSVPNAAGDNVMAADADAGAGGAAGVQATSMVLNAVPPDQVDVIDGQIDVNEDGVVNTADDLADVSLLLAPSGSNRVDIIDGKIDVNEDGAVVADTVDDLANVLLTLAAGGTDQVDIIDGEIDVDEDGAVDTADDLADVLLLLGNAMAVDAISGGTVDATRTVMNTDPFTIDIAVTDGTVDYVAYQEKFTYDPTVLDYDSHAFVTTPLTLCAGLVIDEVAGTVQAGCGAMAPTNYEGPVETITFHCLVQDGSTSALHLLSMVDDPIFGTTTAWAPGATITTDLTDAQIQCGEAPATITVTKSMINDDGGLLDVPDFDLFVNGTGVTSGVPTDFPAGNYTVSETDPAPAYTYTITGDCAANGSITLVSGQTYACTITNDDQPPTLTVTKTVITDDGGTEGVGDFDLFIDGTPVTSGVPETLPVGAYVVSETDPAPAYTYTIGGDCTAGGDVTLALGEHKACTIENDDVAPTLTVTKTVINDDGGTDVVADFTLYIDGTVVTSGVAETLLAGAHAVSEDNPLPFYSYTIGGECAPDGSITLAPGDDKACTIENDDLPPTPAVSIDKKADGSDGPIFVTAGDTVTYEWTVTNTGNTDLTDVSVDDDTHNALDKDCGALVPGATCTDTEPIVLGSAGTVTDTAEVTTTEAASDSDSVTVNVAPAFDCLFEDDFGRGTTLTTTGSNWEFSWNSETISGTGVSRVGDQVRLFSFSGGAMIFGRGTCACGPGSFQAIIFAQGLLLSLVDAGCPPTPTPTATEVPPTPTPTPIPVPPGCVRYTSSDVPKPIQDHMTTLSTITVPDSFGLCDVDVGPLYIDHTWDSDLDVSLNSPATTSVELFTWVGGSGNNFTGTVLDDQCATPIGSGSAPFTGCYQPEGSLSGFNGENSSGVWTLDIHDAFGGDEGSLNSWDLVLCSAPCDNAMAVDAVSGGGVDASTTLTSTDPFDVDIVVTEARSPYLAEQYQLQWDPAVLAYDAEAPTLLDGLTMCGVPTVGASTVYNGCAATAPTTATGAVHTVTLHCLGDGTSPLHLVTMVQDPTFGTTTSAGPGSPIPTTLTDASVTCSLPPVFDCVFSDDFGRGTTLGIVDSSWEFGWNGETISGTGAIRVGDQVLLFSRSGDAMIFGRGTCPCGPGSFQAIIFAQGLLLSLVDVTDACG